jgi:RNA polymerase sigma factor (sigma-70 family)
MTEGAATAISHAFREEAGRVTAALIRRFKDFDLAEECVQDALVSALETWPRDGIPDRPGAWLTTVANRRALNRIKRDRRYQEKLGQIAIEHMAEGEDDRLRLILICCHPALSREAQLALTLRAVAGFTTQEIARGFLVSETTVAQRLVRAKRKIAAAGIPYRVPSGGELGERLSEVLEVLYLIFNEGHLATAGERPSDRDLAEDAAWLATLLHRLLPKEPEPAGLLALMKLHLARGDTRFTAGGELVLLPGQERSRWNHDQIDEALALLERAGRLGRPGPYQLEAAIAACHTEAADFESTDWRQIVALYDMLLVLAPSPVVRLNRAIALARVEGPEIALREIDALSPELDDYHLFHAARGEMLTELGKGELARAAQLRALALTSNSAERALLSGRLVRSSNGRGPRAEGRAAPRRSSARAAPDGRPAGRSPAR